MSENREAIYDGWSNGEVIAQVAPAIGREPDEIEHVVLIYITKDGHLGGRSTECNMHSNLLCQLAAERLFTPIQLNLDDVLGKGYDTHDPHID